MIIILEIFFVPFLMWNVTWQCIFLCYFIAKNDRNDKQNQGSVHYSFPCCDRCVFSCLLWLVWWCIHFTTIYQILCKYVIMYSYACCMWYFTCCRSFLHVKLHPNHMLYWLFLSQSQDGDNFMNWLLFTSHYKNI